MNVKCLLKTNGFPEIFYDEYLFTNVQKIVTFEEKHVRSGNMPAKSKLPVFWQDCKIYNCPDLS